MDSPFFAVLITDIIFIAFALELNKKNALNSNYTILKNITDVIKKDSKNFNNTFLIHISTDQVYSGKGPHSEKRVKPKNYYAYTKLKAEKLLINIAQFILHIFLQFLILEQSKKNQ